MRLAFMSKCKRSEIKALVGIVELLQKAKPTSKNDYKAKAGGSTPVS